MISSQDGLYPGQILAFEMGCSGYESAISCSGWKAHKIKRNFEKSDRQGCARRDCG